MKTAYLLFTGRHLLVDCPSLGNMYSPFLSRCLREDGLFHHFMVLEEDVSYNSTVLVFLDMLRNLVYLNKFEYNFITLLLPMCPRN